jgi:predicted metal-dependent hydrolase
MERMNKPPAKIDYRLRVSPRARRVSLRIKPWVGLEVVVPKRFPQHRIERILQQHEPWIRRQLARHAPSLATPPLPTRVSLRAIGRVWQVVIEDEARQLSERAGKLVLPRARAQAVDSLRGWVRRKARQHLPARLRELARAHGFGYERVSIRSQKSRWGSCSSRGTISLNDQLMFLPPDAVDYLLIHELCHTREMNHSPRFWALVESCCPEWRRLDAELSPGLERVPDWFRHSLLNPSAE